MGHTITLCINDALHPVQTGVTHWYTIREDSRLGIAVRVADPGIKPAIFLEDTELEWSLAGEATGFTYSIPTAPYFTECFGQAQMWICVEGAEYTLFFDVEARKITAATAEKMIHYLAAQHTSFVRAESSRTVLSVSHIDRKTAEPEAIISAAEHYLAALTNHRTELVTTKRTRLAPIRRPLWKTNRVNDEIDPADILNHLDGVSPTIPVGELFLRGRHYAVGDIHVSTLQETADVFENHILLGGLYAIRAKILAMFDTLQPQTPSPIVEGEVSFERLLRSFTSTGLTQRSHKIAEHSAQWVRFFEEGMGVHYAGDILPVMTPYVRTSKMYRVLYTTLSRWYALGSPAFTAQYSLLKIKSLSKLYELYAFFHIVNHLLASSWEYLDAEMDVGPNDVVPREITLQKGSVVATVLYEPTILPLTAHHAQHNDLVDVVHRRPGEPYNYWKPDYVIRFEGKSGRVKYVVIDAKYSTEEVVRATHLPEAVKKYYWGIAAYDANRHLYANDAIAAVMIVYPVGTHARAMGYEQRMGLGSMEFPLPVITAVGLGVDYPQGFQSAFDKLLKAVTQVL